MAIIRKSSNPYFYFQESKTGKLVAVEKEKMKDKKSGAKEVSGYFFVLDDEHQSLKIDFAKEHTFQLKDLIKADIQ